MKKNKDHGEIYRICEYISGGFSPAELNYSTSEKELLAIVKAIRKCHSIIFGRYFEVYTDHKPLKHLLSKSNMHPRLRRWIDETQWYNFKIFYIKGKDNQLADGLSRIPFTVPTKEVEEKVMVICAMGTTQANSDNITLDLPLPEDETPRVCNKTNFELVDGIAKQDGIDEELDWIKSLVLSNIEKPKIKGQNEWGKDKRTWLQQFDKLCIRENSVLYRQHETKKGQIIYQYCLPLAYLDEVIDRTHARHFSGHLGRRKTIQKIEKRYYRPNIRDAINLFIKTCDLCQKIKINHLSRRKGELIPIYPTRPNQIV